MDYLNINTRLLLCFLVASGLTFWLIPSVVNIARKKRLFADPNDRSSHTESTPTLGGLAIFTGVALSTLLFFNFTAIPKFQYAIAGLLIIFFTGIKDDLLGITPFQKFVAQITAVLIIVIFGGIRFTWLHGFIGIFGMNDNIGIVVSVIAIVGITNCFNLMDGIDGLSASLGILASVVFGTWFYMVGDYDWAMLCVGLTGALIAFFYFNVFSVKHKIFMGDTGSLILGFIMAIMVIRFNEANIGLTGPWHVRAAPAVSFGIIMVPVFDTLRVFITRIFRNVSPFSPDKTHIHHYLLELGFSHFQATLVLFITGMLFVAVSWFLRGQTVAWLLIWLLLMGAVLWAVPILIVEWRKRRGETRRSNML